MNDKYDGRIYQPQYFAIAEQSNRIFTINELLIKHAIGICMLHPDVLFTVQVSPRFFEKEDAVKKLDLLFKVAPNNIIISLDARALSISGEIGRMNLLSLVEKYNLKIMLDNPETERLSILFDYPIQYVRLDGRYYRDRSNSKLAFIKVIGDYCKKLKINICAKHINSRDERAWMLANGIRYVEGNFIQKAKSSVTASLKKQEVKQY